MDDIGPDDRSRSELVQWPGNRAVNRFDNLLNALWSIARM
jgi:hypothetical protein